jgi:hypothetical protein
MQDRRSSPRSKVLDYAIASVPEPHYEIRCILKDMSQGGAQLVGDLVDTLPDRFRLTTPRFRRSVPCRVVWRGRHALGLRFEESPALLSQSRSETPASRPRAVPPPQTPKPAAAPAAQPPAADVFLLD